MISALRRFSASSNDIRVRVDLDPRTRQPAAVNNAGVIQLIAEPTTDLFAPIPHGDGQTMLREALLVADHNAYHLGQLVFLRRCLGTWGG